MVVFDSLFNGIKDDNYVVVNFNGVDINIAKRIGSERIIAYVENVVSAAFGTEDKCFSPEYMEIAKEVYLIACYTDVDLSDKKPSEIYTMSYEFGLHDIIMSVIDVCQYSSIIACIDKKSKYLADTESSKLRSDIESIKSTFDSLLGVLNDIAVVDKEDMKNAISAIGKINGVSEKEWLDAIINASKTIDKE